MKIPRQCAILVGGLGTRLGALTAETPKPLLDCGGRPFLAWVLRELSRFGVEEAILLAGYRSERVERFCRELPAWLPKAVSVRVSVEPAPAGTGGALWHARHLLEDSFLLLNGDSWLDANLARFLAASAAAPDALGSVLLRSMPDCSRYGRAELRGDRIVALHEKSPASGPGLINGGMYVFDKEVLPLFSPECSIERDILPELARRGQLAGCVLDGYFIDIGIPGDYERAGMELPRRLMRPAICFEAESLFREAAGSADGWHMVPGAADALGLVNDAGMHAFAVAGEGAPAGWMLREGRSMVAELLLGGATLDDCCCEQGQRGERRGIGREEPGGRERAGGNRPAGGMTDMLARWGVVHGRSVLIGGKTAGASVDPHEYAGTNGDLAGTVKGIVARVRSASGEVPGP